MGETDLFVSYIKTTGIEPAVILDLGSRDGLQSRELAEAFPNTTIFAFEPNPDTIGQVFLNTANLNVKVVNAAVGEENKIVDFYRTTHGNPGASSVYLKSGKYDYIENYQQAPPIQVPCIRLDTFLSDKIDFVDAVWADIQGSELSALKGMGKLLDDVKVIFLEVEFKEMYKGQPLYDEIDTFLKGKGFKQVWIKKVHDDFFGECIYVK